MALIICDSFDHYASADLWKKYVNAWNSQISAGNGRNGTACGLLCYASSVETIITGSVSSAIMGVAAFWNDAINGTSWPLFYFKNDLYTQATVNVTNNGEISVVNGNNGIQGITSGLGLKSSTWHYIECKMTVSATVGTYEVRVNGVTVLTGSNKDTRHDSAADSLITKVALSGVTYNYATRTDDYYVCDLTGSLNNDFLGDVRVMCVMPSGDGTNTAWAASAGSDYQCVDEATLNDTDYISSSTPGQKDTFNFTDLTGTMSVKAVQVHFAARKDNAGSRVVREICRSGGTDYNGTDRSIGDSYTYYQQIRETNPDTAAAWDVAGVNAAEFGVELVS